VELPVPSRWNVLAYVFRGRVEVGRDARVVQDGQLAVLAPDGDAVVLAANGGTAEVLVLGGEPIGEPTIQYGPFVMNTEDEIHEAIADYRAGRMGEIAPELAPAPSS
jgi:redox-sensitive bicupin YhaK (pirin superfamily)